MQWRFEAADNLQGAGLFWHNIQCGTTSTLNIISDMCHLILVVDPSTHSKTQELGIKICSGRVSISTEGSSSWERCSETLVAGRETSRQFIIYS